jgi:hypothetical protein
MKALLEALPESDEDPAVFWGPNWRQDLKEAEAELAARPRQVYHTLDAFFASLEDDTA